MCLTSTFIYWNMLLWLTNCNLIPHKLGFSEENFVQQMANFK